MPNSSAPTAKTKSVWLSGRMRLTVPSPGPFAEPAAAREAFQREIDVEGVARAAVHEALDALRDVRHGEIGADEADAGEAGEPADPDEPHPRHEEQRAPDQRDQHGLAEVGLHHQQGHDHQQQRQRRGVGRHLRPPRRFGEQPGDQDHERGFEELRGLHVDAEDDEPAPRALDLGAEERRRRDQEEADQEHHERDAPDLPRRQERGRQQHHDGRRQEQDVAVDEMEGVEIEPRRHRRTGGERQDDAAQHEAEHRRQHRAIHRPPPLAEGRAYRARNHGCSSSRPSPDAPWFPRC